MHTLEELDVYNLSQSFSDKIWFLVLNWNKFEQFGIGRQISNSADSISSNIAEGSEGFSSRKILIFAFIAEALYWKQKIG